MYTVTIRKEHCEGTKYADCSNCAACKAFREQHPAIHLDSMLWDEFYLKNHVMIKGSQSFTVNEFSDLLKGHIKEFVIEVPELEKYYKELTKDNSITPKTEFSPVTFSEIKETILLSNS